MAEFVQKGESLNYRNKGSELIRYGEVVVLEERIGVAGIDIPAGSLGTVGVSGVYEMPAETGTAFQMGQTLWWDTENKRLTATKAADGAILAGYAAEAKAAESAAALCKL